MPLRPGCPVPSAFSRCGPGIPRSVITRHTLRRAMLRRSQEGGARISYLSSHRNPDDVALDAFVLQAHGFPVGRVLARQPGENYGDVAGREAPDVLIEDDCESIGAGQITYPQIPAALQARIKSIIIPEFGGIDHLPDNPQALLT